MMSKDIKAERFPGPKVTMPEVGKRSALSAGVRDEPCNSQTVHLRSTVPKSPADLSTLQNEKATCDDHYHISQVKGRQIKKLQTLTAGQQCLLPALTRGQS